uniref:Uncharacterized protein n=1 Tax=Buteo japonicus TaxID=224669 RepID=A0A8C0APP3_9AVES
MYLELSFYSDQGHAAQDRWDNCYYLPSYIWVTPAIGMLGQLDTVQSKHNLMIPEQRSLNLFTRNPPRNVPPPPKEQTTMATEVTRFFLMSVDRALKMHLVQMC